MIQLLSNLGLVAVAQAQRRGSSGSILTWDKFSGLIPSGMVDESGDVNKVKSIVITILDYFLVAAFIIAFVYLVLYGIKYITSGGDAAKATEARNGIINAIIGIVVISLTFFIISFATNLGRTLAQ